MEEAEPPLTLSPDTREIQDFMEDACRASMAGELERVKQALGTAQTHSAYTGVDGHGHGGRSPLYQACLGRQPEVVSYLLKQGAVDRTGDAYISICAAGNGSVASEDPAERTAALMREAGFVGSPLKAKKKGGERLRKVAKEKNKVTPRMQVQAALQGVLDTGDASGLMAPTIGGELPIHFAAKSGDGESVRQLLQAADGAARTEQLLRGGKGERLPLHYACLAKKPAIIAVLIGDNAAQSGGDGACAPELVEEQLTCQDSDHKLPLHLALQSADMPTIDALVRCGSGEHLCHPNPSTHEFPVHSAIKVGCAGEKVLLDAMVGVGGEGLLLHQVRHAAAEALDRQTSSLCLNRSILWRPCHL